MVSKLIYFISGLLFPEKTAVDDQIDLAHLSTENVEAYLSCTGTTYEGNMYLRHRIKYSIPYMLMHFLNEN